MTVQELPYREWRVKIGGCRLHEPVSPVSYGNPKDFFDNLAYGNRTLLPPEVLESYASRKPPPFKGVSDIQAFDVWATGEVAAQMLTGKPTFGHNLRILDDYRTGKIPFPTKDLDEAMVSGLGKRFITTFMHPDIEMRPTLPLDPNRDDLIPKWLEPGNCWYGKELKPIPLATFYHNKILSPTMHYTPDGSKLVVIDPYTITIRSSSAGVIKSWIYENDRHAAYGASALSPCGKRLAVYDRRPNSIKIFDLSNTRNTEPSISYPVSEPLMSPKGSNSPSLKQPQTILGFHPTGSKLLSASPSTFATLDLSVLPQPDDPLPYQLKTDSSEEPILNAFYAKDGHSVIISRKNLTTVTMLSTGEVVRRVAHPVPASVVALAPDGLRLFLGAKNGDIWYFDAPSLFPLKRGEWVPVWKGKDGYPVDSIDIAHAPGALTQEGKIVSSAVTVAVVSGERLTLLSVGDLHDDYCFGWVEFKMRKAEIAKIKPRSEGENHLEIALWSGGESRITFLKFEGFYGKDKGKSPELTVAREPDNCEETAKEQKKKQDCLFSSNGGILACEDETEIDDASEEDGGEKETARENEERDGSGSSGCGSWVLENIYDIDA